MLMLVVFLVRIPLNQDCWFELTIIRTTRVNRIADHMSAVFVQLLGLFFGGEGQDLELGGLTVEFVDGASATIFADVLFSIADEAALHAMYGCKGSSGLKICCCCTNVFNANTPRRIVEADRSGQSVYHHCTDPTKFKRITPAVLDAIVRRLLRARPSELADLETDLGWKLQPHGIMFHPTARRRMCPSNKLCYDWAHIFMVNGLWNFVVCKVLLKFREHDIKPPVISTYVESFSWPAGTAATRLFTHAKCSLLIGSRVRWQRRLLSVQPPKAYPWFLSLASFASIFERPIQSKQFESTLIAASCSAKYWAC